MRACAGTFNAKAAGVALGRWALGVLMLVSGVKKIGHVAPFVQGYLVPEFSKTILPSGMVASYGYALPYVECLLGVLLLLGIGRNTVLLLNGLTLLSLALGQMLLGNNPTVGNLFTYLILNVIVLYAGDHDRWSCCGRGVGSEKNPSPGA